MNPTVLVIEPHADFCAEIVATLTRQKYECDAVASVDDALLKIRDGNYSCILLDVDSLPAAAEVADLVERSRTAENLVLITETDAREDLPSLAGSAYPLLRKPFDRRQLLALVGR